MSNKLRTTQGQSILGNQFSQIWHEFAWLLGLFSRFIFTRIYNLPMFHYALDLFIFLNFCGCSIFGAFHPLFINFIRHIYSVTRPLYTDQYTEEPTTEADEVVMVPDRTLGKYFSQWANSGSILQWRHILGSSFNIISKGIIQEFCQRYEYSR